MTPVAKGANRYVLDDILFMPGRCGILRGVNGLAVYTRRHGRVLCNRLSSLDGQFGDHNLERAEDCDRQDNERNVEDELDRKDEVGVGGDV